MNLSTINLFKRKSEFSEREKNIKTIQVAIERLSALLKETNETKIKLNEVLKILNDSLQNDDERSSEEPSKKRMRYESDSSI